MNFKKSCDFLDYLPIILFFIAQNSMIIQIINYDIQIFLYNFSQF